MNMRKPHHSHKTWLKCLVFQFSASVFTAEDTDNIAIAEPLFRGGKEAKLLDINVDKYIVHKKLDCLCSDKAVGADDMSPRVLVELKNEITLSLKLPVRHIMKCSLDSGTEPDDLRAAYVTTVYKKDAKSNVSNFCPLRLTSKLCKIFKAIVRDTIVDHLEKHGLVKETEHGFREGGSCVSNLLQFIDKVTCSTNDKNV